MRSEPGRLWRTLAVLACTLAASAVTACTSTLATQRTTPAPVLTTARVDDPSFALALSAPERVAVGTQATASLSIEGRGEYHVNHEYPLRIALRGAPEVGLSRSELAGPNAKELTPARARFEVPFTCRAAGAHRIEADVEFALCTDDACIPKTVRIALTVHARR